MPLLSEASDESFGTLTHFLANTDSENAQG